VAFGVQYNILRLQIAIDYAVTVQALQGQDDLSCVEAGSLFGEFRLLAQVEEELTSVKKINNEVEALWGLEGVMQLDDKWVINPFQNHAFN